MSWCQFKVAYLLDIPDLKPLDEVICDGDIFDLMEKCQLPDGWEFRGTDISGAAGFVLIFDIDEAPKPGEQEAVVSALKALVPLIPEKPVWDDETEEEIDGNDT